MPKQLISPLIYEGHWEYYLRIQIKTRTEGRKYVAEYFPKKDYSLQDVERIRNTRLDEYQKSGERDNRLPSLKCYTTSYLKSNKIK